MQDDSGTGAEPILGVPAAAVSSSTNGSLVARDALHDPDDDEVTGSGRALHSDPHDFAGLYIRHRFSFTLHARRYLRDPRDADEVVQESFLRLFLALPELQTELQALAYCRRTITNLCIDRYRAQARRPSLVALDSVPVEDLADEDQGDPVIRAEDAATVREALSLLSPLHRAALVKREIEEKPLPQIAAELDIPEESVKHVLFRARRALRRLLAGTSLAPGADGEATGRSLSRVLSKGSGGVAALIVLLALGVGSGQDLRSIPVAGPLLAELPSIGDVVRSVGNAFTGGGNGPVIAVGSGAGSGAVSGAQLAGHDGAGLFPLPSGAPTPAPATATVGIGSGVLLGPGGFLGLPALPLAAASAAPSPAASPTDVPSVRPSSQPAHVPVVVRVPGRGDGALVPPAAQPDAGSGPGGQGAVDAKPAAGAGTTVPASPAPLKPAPAISPDKTSWNTPGLVWQNDPANPQVPVLAPVGQAPGFDS